MTKQQFRTYGIIVGIILVAFLALAITHALGYRVTARGLVKAATLEIVVEESGSKVFINNKKEATTGKDNDRVVIKNVTPGLHEILISKDGYWPWAKQVTLLKDQTARVHNFALRMDAEGIIIPKEDPEYRPLLLRMASSTRPTQATPIRSEDGNAIAWIADRQIFIQWIGNKAEAPSYLCSQGCENVEVFSSAESIGNLEFYKDRNDILLFSAANGIFAIEAGKESIQNFQPLYKGAALGINFFIDRIDNVLYAKDGETLLIINL